METPTFYTRNLLISFFLLITSFLVRAQYCDSLVPVSIVDLSASPNQTWVSPYIVRDGNCCGTSNPDNCLEFIITLHPNAIAVNFEISGGAVPPGALFYQIDCGPVTPVGSPICLSGAGPHHLTFCKPGNNANEFSITSYSEPIIGPDITLNSACSGFLFAQYYNEPSMTWTSVAPGAPGTYDGLLSCTSGCDTTYITAPNNPPAFIDYVVCGSDIGGCNPLPYCDTIRVNFIQPVTVDITPDSTHLCFGDPGQLLTTSVSGGTPPYNYVWSTAETTTNIIGTNGTYWVNVTDASGCLIASDTAIVVQDALPILANAGADINVCQQNPGVIVLNGSIQMATGGIWSGGAGAFIPDNTTLNATYVPTPLEIANGSVTLTLTSTGNNGCSPDSDDVVINLIPFTNTFNLTVNDISCFGANDGSAVIDVFGLYNPVTYSWDAGPITGVNSINGLTPGAHQVQIINSMGCDTTIAFMVNEPSALSVSIDSVLHNLCFGGQSGIAYGNVSGGTSGYTYSWNTNPVQTGINATGLAAGIYTLTATDANGCVDSAQAVITETSQLTLALSGVSPDCYGNATGAVSSVVNGGTPLYSYQWANGPTGSNQYNLLAGTYTLTVTDANGCQITDSVTLVDPPQLIGTVTPDSVICPGSNIDLITNINGGTGSYYYLWSPNGEITASITVNPSQYTAYGVEVTDDNGCVIQLNTTVDVITLDPNDLQAQISNTVSCSGDTVWISGSYTGNDPTVSLSWLHCPTCSTTQPIAETPTSYTEYILSATNSCGQMIYDTVSVNVNQLPNLQIGLSSNSVCPDETVYFSNLGDNDPSWTYAWDFGDGNGSNQMNAVHSYANSAVYPISLTVTDNNGCTSNLFDADTIVVNQQAVADFDASFFHGTMMEPTIDFYNQSINASNFWWDFGDGYNSGEAYPSHEYQEAGDYTVTLYAYNQYGCNDSISMGVFLEPAFELYVPNAFTPDNDDFNELFFPKGFGIADEGYTFRIFNRWGDLVFETHEMDRGWNGYINGDQMKAQDGVYTWVVIFRDERGGRHQRKGHVSLLK